MVCVYACWWRGTLNPSGPRVVSNSESHDTVDGNHIHVLCKNSVCFSLLSNLFIPKHLEKKIHSLFVSVSYSGYNISHLVLNCFTWIVWLIVIMLTYTINIIGLNGVSERWKTFRMQQPAMASASSVHKFPWSPQQSTGLWPLIFELQCYILMETDLLTDLNSSNVVKNLPLKREVRMKIPYLFRIYIWQWYSYFRNVRNETEEN